MAFICASTLRGLAYLHRSKRIIHRDIKVCVCVCVFVYVFICVCTGAQYISDENG